MAPSDGTSCSYRNVLGTVQPLAAEGFQRVGKMKDGSLIWLKCHSVQLKLTAAERPAWLWNGGPLRTGLCFAQRTGVSGHVVS